MNERDPALIDDMQNEARRALKFIQGRTRADLDDDDLLAYAVVRALEIIGEAATRVSDVTRQTYSDIEWRAIIGMRHRIVHDYLRIDYDIVWAITQNNLPALITQLQGIIDERAKPSE